MPAAAIRIGQGYDVHAFGDGDHVMLGGVRVPHERGVLAHSDGDVVLHALCDAMLGALALGDMGEVGDNGPEMHREVGAYAREHGIERLVTLGEASRLAAQAFGEQARACGTVEEVVAALREAAPASVLVKGSRFMRMERVVQGFSSNNNNTPHGAGDRHAA